MIEKGITKFEIILGLASLAVLALVVMPPLHGGMSEEKSIRAVAGAENIARAILDFRCDTGTWPGQMGDYADLSCLTRTMQSVDADRGLVGTMGGAGHDELQAERTADFRPWLKEVPLDPWHRAYRVAVLSSGGEPGQDLDESWQAAPTRTGVYPIEPPAGVAICVVSAGPDGEWSTDLAQLSLTADTDRELPAGGAVTPVPSVQFSGDDLGFVLRGSAPGGGS